MNHSTERTDEQLIGDLQALYRSGVAEAAEELRTRPLDPRRTRRGGSLVRAVLGAGAVVVAIVVAVPLLAGRSAQEPVGDGGSTTSALPAAEGSPEPSVTVTTASGLLVVLQDGLPVRVGSEPVLRGTVADDAILRSVDATPILIAGWLRADQAMSCPIQPGPWNPCRAIQLFTAQRGGIASAVYPDGARMPIGTVSGADVQAAVLRVHTHDDSCAAGADCAQLPALNGVVWLGAAQRAGSTLIGGSAPPDGLSADAAVAAGLSHVTAIGPVTARSGVAGPYENVVGGASPVAPDRWVWAIVFSGDIRSPGCPPPPSEPVGACGPAAPTQLVVIDYIDGSFIESDAPAPSPRGP